MTDHLYDAATAVERLTRSREALRLALRGAQTTPPEGQARGWWRNLMAMPGAALLAKALHLGISRDPLISALQAVASAALAAFKPLVQRHPLGFAAGAFVAGGLVVLFRPWRWAFKVSIVAGLLPQILALLLAQQARSSSAETAKADPPVF